ncbi:hypothetical protein D9756_004388 [Leucocoprinus leucothites]|uniref:EF-hand domain-containing protein n=1 Tax=Leucocoprinus leucothites TaxID=201217 RepID=A0A8H5DBQ1_9AGAR|nr:hypothetical protein D9756_004388 [Leucoagaricus leucothites]
MHKTNDPPSIVSSHQFNLASFPYIFVTTMVVPADASKDAPGTGWSKDTKKEKNSELQEHVAFFDKDRDGIIWPTDTLYGLRDLGFGYFWTIVGTLTIHLTFSWITWGSIPPDPYFRLKVNRIHKAKHGSDTEVYTGTGEFDPDRFEYMWYMYTEKPHTHITINETMRMVRGDLNPFDPFGWFCATFEWIPLFILLDPADGKMAKDDVKAVYDGSLFWRIAEQNQQRKNLGAKNGKRD